MFTEPLNITIGTVTTALQRVGFGDMKGSFRDAATGLRFSISHTVGKRNRSNVRLDFSKLAADPLLAGVNRAASGSVYCVLDTPSVGFTAAELEDYLEALASWLSVQGNRDKVINGES